MQTVNFKGDIDSQIAIVRKRGFRETKRIPRGLRRNKNRHFVKSLSGVLNVYAIINQYGILFDYFELQEGPFLKMVEELKDVTQLYKRYDKRIGILPYRKKKEKTISEETFQKISALTKKNRKLMETAGSKYVSFLKKYSNFYTYCIRHTFKPDGIFLYLFALGQGITRPNRTLFFKFWDALLENRRVYTEIRGKGAPIYTPDVRKRLHKAYSIWKQPCRKIYNELMNCSSPYEKSRELAMKDNLPVTLFIDVVEAGSSLTNFTLSVAYWDVFKSCESIPLNYLRKVLPGKIRRTLKQA